MKTTMLKIAVAAALAVPLSSQALIHVFQAKLDASQEVQATPVVSPALGAGTVIFDDVAKTITLSMAGGGLTAPITDAHIHRAPAGTSGPVIFPLKALPEFIGFGQTFFFMSLGATAFPEAEIPNLLADNTYLNIHTEAFTSGEIRGQLLSQIVAQPIPEPETYALMIAGLGLVGWVASRRRKVGV
jgi:hypothetical protein